MALSHGSNAAPAPRPAQPDIDQIVRLAMLQRAKVLLGLDVVDDAGVAARLPTYGIRNFVLAFIDYAKKDGWVFEASDIPYLDWMAGKLPN